jgi:hypothetical protein
MKKKINVAGALLFAFFLLMPSLCLADQEIPNLVGHWTVKVEGATLIRDKNVGKSAHFGDENQTTLEAEADITSQKGRVFYGMFKSSRATEQFIGVIGHDNKSMYYADEDGFDDGKIISNDTMEIVYRHVTPQQTTVAVGKWTRK